MLRTSSSRISSLLAIALSVSALVSVTGPATALPQHALGGMQPSQDAMGKVAHQPRPLPGVRSKSSPGNAEQPMPHSNTTKNAQIPETELPRPPRFVRRSRS
jgi:hypothetical protein